MRAWFVDDLRRNDSISTDVSQTNISHRIFFYQKQFNIINFSVHIVIHFFVCFEFFNSTREFFTHIETSSLPVKGFKFWPILDTRGHWAVRFFLTCHTYCDTSQPFITAYNGPLRGPVTLAPVAERWKWSCHYLFLRLKSIGSGIRTLELSHARLTLQPTVPHRCMVFK